VKIRGLFSVGHKFFTTLCVESIHAMMLLFFIIYKSNVRVFVSCCVIESSDHKCNKWSWRVPYISLECGGPGNHKPLCAILPQFFMKLALATLQLNGLDPLMHTGNDILVFPWFAYMVSVQCMSYMIVGYKHTRWNVNTPVIELNLERVRRQKGIR
jgi:hypothetical protein